MTLALLDGNYSNGISIFHLNNVQIDYVMRLKANQVQSGNSILTQSFENQDVIMFSLKKFSQKERKLCKMDFQINYEKSHLNDLFDYVVTIRNSVSKIPKAS